jgi:GTP-binding protein
VVLEVDPHLSTLLDFRYRREFRAARGQHGGGSGKTGRSAEDLVVRVPPGTEVRDTGAGAVLGDLIAPGQRLVVAKGGRGGRGNEAFATAKLRAPQTAEDGLPGEERELVLTLKLLADVGLVGLPNAGKSTLLASMSAARPKVADYPFTTLVPHLGIVKAGEYASFVMADIPGLIEGASEGKGLGHRFLRHVERTRILLFLVECTDPEPDRTVRVLEQELENHAPHLLEKPRLVALSKVDLLAPEEDPPGLSRFSSRPFMISAHSRRGLPELITMLHRTVQDALDEEASISLPPSGEAGVESE